MTSATKAKISRGIREAIRRKRLSVAMKASWARRRNHNTEEPDQSIHSLFKAADMLVEHNDLKAAVVENFSTDDIVSALAGYNGSGTSTQTKLRQILTNQIKTALV